MEIGEIIRIHRKQAGFTQEELGEYAGVGKTTVFDVEHGKKSIHFNNLLKILHVLNIKLDWDSPLKAKLKDQEIGDSDEA